MATTPPALGYGQRGEAPINSVNQWMRSQPWYTQLITSFGQTPNNVHLNDAQKQQVIRAAQANGVIVDEGHNGQEVDDSGNFQAKSHALRNTLIVAGIAGAALLTAGAAGAFAGAAAPAAGALPAGVTLEGTAAGLGGASTVVGAGGTAAAGGGAAAGAASAVPWSTIVASGSGLFGNLFAANIQANAADRAAQVAAAGNKYSADLTAKANADALKFQYANAENAYQNNEASRQGNYGLFAARERRLGTIGEEVGLGPREIPAYVPGVDPHFGSVGDAASAGAPPAAGGASTATSPSDPSAILAALTDNYTKLGVRPTGPGSGPTDIAYFAKQIAATGGLAPTNTSYWFGPTGRIAQEIAKAQGGAPSTAPAAARPVAPATTATPFMNVVPMAPGVPQALGYYA
jgi:hypothetical protein